MRQPPVPAGQPLLGLVPAVVSLGIGASVPRSGHPLSCGSAASGSTSRTASAAVPSGSPTTGLESILWSSESTKSPHSVAQQRVTARNSEQENRLPPGLFPHLPWSGTWRYLLCKQGVAGSNPVVSTGKTPGQAPCILIYGVVGSELSPRGVHTCPPVLVCESGSSLTPWLRYLPDAMKERSAAPA